MNKTFTTVIGALIGVAAYATPAIAQDVGVSISIGQPGFYGQIDIGGAPRPRIIYSQPVYIERRARYEEPIYLHVRPGHSRNWKRHCREYNACGRRVYFVNDNWYNTTYVEHYRGRGDHHDGRQEGHHRDDRRDEGHDGRRDHDRGRGHENGRGNGKHHD
jgi:hypothetical protein